MTPTLFRLPPRLIPSRRLAPLLLTALATALVTAGASAASWYVDSRATGTGAGTSWANAWTNTTAIRWSSVLSGDTVWLSGGSTGLSYSGFQFGKSGSGTNHITVRVAQEVGRNGLVQIDGTINGYGNTNIIINGARDDNFAVPASVTDLWQITNNIGIRVESDGVNLMFSRFENSKVLWVEAAYAGSFDANECHGMWANCYDTVVDRSEVGYCYVHDSSKDGINVGGAGNDADPWNNVEVHHSIIWRNVDDGIQMGASGLNSHHNIIGVKSMEGTSGHPDTIQMSGSQYLRVYNSILYNSWNSWLYNEINVPSEWSAVGNLLFYGNICYNERDWIGNDAMNYGFFAQTWRDPGGGVNPIGPVNDSILTNVYICNNVFYNQKSGTVLMSHSQQHVPHVEVWRTVVTNFVFENNVILDCSYASEQSTPFVIKGTFPSTDVDPTNNPPSGMLGMFYTTAEVVVDYNVVGGAKSKMGYGGVAYDRGEDLEAIGFSHNSSAVPRMLSTNTYDFRLTSTDTAARNKGANLSSLAAKLPGILIDLYGNVRGADGAWDIGAHEYTSGSATTYALAVTSVDPNSGVVVEVGPPDNSGSGGGTTPFTRIYGNGVTVTLKAPTVVPGGGFVKWQMDGMDLSSNTSVTMAMTAPRALRAVYQTGASPLPTGSLVLHLDFEGDWTAGRVDDRSGNGAHGYRFGRRGEFGNWPTATSRTFNGTDVGAANFDWVADGYGAYGKSGAYIGVTNIANFNVLSEATIACWAHYDAGYDGSWVGDGNATLIDGGYGYAGAWSLGRFNWTGVSSDRTVWTIYTNSSASAYFTMDFPDNGGRTGDTGGWHHYAVTYSGGLCTTYYDGVPVASTPVPGSIPLDIRPAWLAIGCRSHNAADPYLNTSAYPNDEYPNHAWLNGQIDDVVIYGRALSPGEVSGLFTGVAVSGSRGPRRNLGAREP